MKLKAFQALAALALTTFTSFSTAAPAMAQDAARATTWDAIQEPCAIGDGYVVAKSGSDVNDDQVCLALNDPSTSTDDQFITVVEVPGLNGTSIMALETTSKNYDTLFVGYTPYGRSTEEMETVIVALHDDDTGAVILSGSSLVLRTHIEPLLSLRQTAYQVMNRN